MMINMEVKCIKLKYLNKYFHGNNLDMILFFYLNYRVKDYERFKFIIVWHLFFSENNIIFLYMPRKLGAKTA